MILTTNDSYFSKQSQVTDLCNGEAGWFFCEVGTDDKFVTICFAF